MTQVQGLMQTLKDEQDETIEDASRLIAQRIVGDGSVFIHGIDQMEAIETYAIQGEQTLNSMESLRQKDHFTNVCELDLVYVFSPFANDEKAREVASFAKKQGAHVIGIASVAPEQGQQFFDECDLTLDLGVKHALVPTENKRIGAPHVPMASIAYDCIYLTVTEMIEEFTG